MAANDLAKLVVKLEAQTANYDANLKKATRELNKFRQQAGTALGKIENQFKQFGSNILKTFALGSVTAAVYGLVRSVGAAVQAGDDLAKFANKAGLTAEAASRLAHAARMADLDLMALGKAVRFMQVNLSTASTEGGEAKKVLDAIGLSAAELKALAPEEQFIAIGAAIKTLPSIESQTRAWAFFGKTGIDVATMFEEGVEGVRKLLKETPKVFTAAELKRLQDADDAFKKIGATVDALAAGLAIALADGINEVSTAFRIFFGKMTEIEELSMQIARMEKLRIPFTDRSPELEQLRARLKLLLQTQNVTDKGAPGAEPKPEATPPDFKPEIKQLAELSAITVTATKIFQDFNQMLKDTETDVQSAGRAYDVFKIKLQELQTAGLISAAEFDNRMREFIDKTIPEVQVTAQRMVVEQEINKMSVYAEQAARNMQDAFADFLFDPFDSGIKGMLKGFVDALRRMLAEAMSARIFEAIGGGSGGGGFLDFLGGIIGFGAGGGSSGGSGAGVPMRAGGGPVRAGAPYIVGEKGPELFIPGASGGIVPNGEGIGGMVFAPVYNMDNRGASMDFIKAMPSILQENNRRLMESLRDARSRGQF